MSAYQEKHKATHTYIVSTDVHMYVCVCRYIKVNLYNRVQSLYIYVYVVLVYK